VYLFRALNLLFRIPNPIKRLWTLVWTQKILLSELDAPMVTNLQAAMMEAALSTEHASQMVLELLCGMGLKCAFASNVILFKEMWLKVQVELILR
jgi:hypothetical protein